MGACVREDADGHVTFIYHAHAHSGDNWHALLREKRCVGNSTVLIAIKLQACMYVMWCFIVHKFTVHCLCLQQIVVTYKLQVCNIVYSI